MINDTCVSFNCHLIKCSYNCEFNEANKMQNPLNYIKRVLQKRLTGVIFHLNNCNYFINPCSLTAYPNGTLATNLTFVPSIPAE